MAGIKKNFIYNSILTTANYIFPILVFPYISRVLGVDNIGICNFVDSIIQNFILLSMLGIPIVGVREVVIAKGDRLKLNKVFSSIFYANAVLTTLAVVVLLICTYTINDLYQHKELMYVGVLKLVGNFLMIEWFFKGLEDFKYITIRSIIVRSLYVISVFVLVQSKDDYILYFILTCSTFVINAIVNIFYSRKFVNLTISILPFKTIAKSIVILGIYMIFTSFYTSFNTSFLGIATDTTQVGYFTTATKLYAIILALFSAFTTVMLPRMTGIYSDGNIEEFKGMLLKCSKLFYSILIPIVIFGVIFAGDIIVLLAGPGFFGAVLPMQVCMVVMLVVGYEQVIIIQGLMPMKRDKSILINSIVGGITALLICFILIPYLGAVGASIVWLSSEIAVAVSASIFMYKYIGFKFPSKDIIVKLLYNLPLGFLLLLLSKINGADNNMFDLILTLLIGGIIVTIYTLVIQCAILKDPLFIDLLKKLKVLKKY